MDEKVEHHGDDDEPDDHGSETNGERSLSRWMSFLGVGAACASALIAVGAAGVSVDQIKVAKQQNENDDRQSLAALVNTMAEKASQLENVTNLNEQSRLQQARFADAEESLTLIKLLKGSVPAVDDYEIGSAFDSSEEYLLALRLLERAAAARSSPHFRANSLRAIAGIYYRLGGQANYRRAYRRIEQAFHAYDDNPDLPQLEVRQNEVFTDLYDVEREPSSFCARARREMSWVGRQMTQTPALTDSSVKAAHARAASALASCSSG